MTRPILIANGVAYASYESIVIEHEFGSLPSSFECIFTNNGQQLPKKLEKYQIKINEKIIQTGIILSCTTIRTSGNMARYLIILNGQDNTRLLQKHCVGQLSIQENIDLLTLANKLVNGLPVNIKTTQPSILINRIKCQPDETVESVLSREVSRFGLILNSDGTNCVIDKEGSGNTIDASLIDSNGVGNIISSTLIEDYSNSYDKFISTTFDYTLPTTLNKNRYEQLFGGLQQYYYQKDYTKPDELKNNLQWVSNINRSLESTYIATIPTHQIENVIPKIGDYIFVEDDYCKVKGLMLIYKTRFGVSENLNWLELTLKEPGIFTNSATKSSQAINLKLGRQ